MPSADQSHLTEIIQSVPWLMQALRDVRSLGLPDWYIGAGAIRNTVWNVQHGIDTTANHNDVDVVYFEDIDPTAAKANDKIHEASLQMLDDTKDWQVTNQSRAYLFDTAQAKDLPKATSACHGISTWTETATCIGVRLELGDTFTFCAPYGLDDLMQCIARPIPEPYQDLEIFEKRMIEKEWTLRWSKLQIVSI